MATALERVKDHVRQLGEKHNNKVKRDIVMFQNINDRLKRLERSPWQKFKDLFKKSLKEKQ